MSPPTAPTRPRRTHSSTSSRARKRRTSWHGYGFASPSSEADTSLLGPVQQIATGAVGSSKVQFVLGDLLPGDLVDEYRVQLQKFLQDPSDATIDAVTAAIEAKAAEAYYGVLDRAATRHPVNPPPCGCSRVTTGES